MSRDYWRDLFTGTTLEECIKAGADISGFRATRGKMMQKISVEDYFLCYLTGISLFFGILEVTGKRSKHPTASLFLRELRLELEIRPQAAHIHLIPMPKRYRHSSKQCCDDLRLRHQ